MSVSFTTEQQKVIDTHGCNLLVSAAAGSGKTAVLVERIVKMVSDKEHPVDIDRLLVVTFTNAAAAEMRERIGNAIGARLAAEPENEHLQRQSALLHNAQIMTIDSFCLFVIRNHFYTIGLDPGFRIADEGELKLLKADVLGEVLEQCYRNGEAAFLHCMEYFSTGSRDKAVEDAVLTLYEFAMSHPFPQEWLQARKEDYVIPEKWLVAADRAYTLSKEWTQDEQTAESAQCLTEPAWLKGLMKETSRILYDMIDRISHCINVCEEPDGPYMYGEILEQEKEMITKLSATGSYEERCRMFDLLSFKRLPSKKDDTVSVIKRELVKNTRGEIKEQLQAMQKDFFTGTMEELISQMQACGDAIAALVEVTLMFQTAFEQMKRDKNILDFDDIEHFALSILLRKEEDGKVVPTETALEYRNHFFEILIDEYQDSNLVQEYLLSAISGEEEGRFNRFMVGDVKQSIYKFRLARPELFMEKYDTYGEEEGGENLRIDLHKNFRSREQVLISTNAVFSQMMRKELGGIVYDEKAALYPGASYPDKEGNPESTDRVSSKCSDYDTELLLFVPKEQEGVDRHSGTDRADDTDVAGFVDNFPDEAVSVKQQEAYGIAAKIKQLVTSFQVTDKETGNLRKASYKDIVILLRTTTGWDEEFKQILEEEGIPVHVTSKTGYFASTEIRELLHFLRVLDNPLQDIPFYGVLHSYFGGFSEEEIAEVKAAFPEKRYLYETVVEYSRIGQSGSEAELGIRQSGSEAEPEIRQADIESRVKQEDLSRRLQAFLITIEQYRDMAVYMPVHEILQTIIRNFAYISYVAAKPGGSRRRANVEMLLVKAADYEKTSYYGMYHFLRYIEQLEKYDVDYGEANLQDENADVVRIMSIHKSKGLEFPICFVAGLGKSFNNRDANSNLVMDVELGIGVNYVNPERRIRTRNLRRNYIASRLRQDNLAEELRILYVAMTRAKEKLILTGVWKKPEKKAASLMLLQGYRERSFSYDTLLQMGSFLDVLLNATARNQCFDEVWHTYGIEPNHSNPFYGEETGIQVSVQQWEDTVGDKLKETILREDKKQRLLSVEDSDQVDRINQQLMTVMSEKFSYRYPYENLKDLYTKTTVSELKKAGMQEETDFAFSLYEEEQIVPYLPKFIKQVEEVSGTDRGSAYHKVMELFDFTLLTKIVNTEGETENDQQKTKEQKTEAKKSERKPLTELVKSELERMLAEGKLSQAYHDAVSEWKIIAFLESDIAGRMAGAAAKGKLYKEQPFVLGLPANRLNAAFPPEETVLIQGIIDVFFEENGSYVVVDYKTDAVETSEELIGRYRTQLDYYGEALEQLSGYGRSDKGLRTAEKIIYSFKLEKEIAL